MDYFAALGHEAIKNQCLYSARRYLRQALGMATMKILFIVDTRRCSHDYGTDFLIQGAYSLLGAESVFEWPEKLNLHLAIGQDRDECQIDSDAWLPTKGDWWNYSRCKQMCRDGMFDVVIFTGVWGCSEDIGLVSHWCPVGTPFVSLHYDDELTDTRPMFAALLAPRSLAAYWHREQPPLGAYPLWLSQPLSRVRPVAHKRPIRCVFYHGVSHGLCSREAMVQSLFDHVDGRFTDAGQIMLAKSQLHRMPPEAYRERLWESAVSVVWNSGPEFPTWQSNRFFESLALGCAVVAERPLYNAPDIDGITWIDRPEDAGLACAALLAEPERMRENAHASQDSFVRSHTSERMLEKILGSVGRPWPKTDSI